MKQRNSKHSPSPWLILLAPDIQANILDGAQPAHLTLADFMKAFPNDWVEQREYFGVVDAD